MSNYSSFVERINQAETYLKLKALDASLDRLYNAGIFTASEFKRLDSKIVDKLSA